jgi:hypothetical protein
MSLNLDISGLDRSNLITGEKQKVTASTITNTGAIFTKNGMFFGNGIQITSELLSGGTITLTKDLDYWLVGKLPGVGDTAGGVYSAIFIADPALAGNFSITYQALGGNLSISTVNINQFYSTVSNRTNAQNCKAIPQPSLGLTIATNKDLLQLQAGRPLIPINIVYAAAAAPVRTTGSSLSNSSGSGTGTGGGTGGGTTTPSGPIIIASITDAGTTGKLLLAAATPAAIKSVLSITPTDIGAATAAQGAKADTALQTVSITDLSDVSSIGASILFASSADTIKTLIDVGVADVSGLGSSALYDVDLFANSMQGARADTSVQSINGQLPDSSGNIVVQTGGVVSASSISDAGVAGKTVLQAATVSAIKNILSLTSADIGGAVKTVNGTAPDGSGNVVVAVSAGSVASGSITDATVIGRTILTAANIAAVKTFLAYTPTDIGAATAAQGAKADTALQTVTSATISDASVLGKSLLTSANAAAVKTALSITGADIVSGVVKTINGGAPDAAGNVIVVAGGGSTTIASITDGGATGKALLAAATPAAAKSALSLTSADIPGVAAAPTVAPGTSLGATTQDGYNGATLTCNTTTSSIIHKNAVSHFSFTVVGTAAPTFTGDALVGGGNVAIEDRRETGTGKSYFYCTAFQTGSNSYVVLGVKS